MWCALVINMSTSVVRRINQNNSGMLHISSTIMSPGTMTTCGDSIVKLLHTSLKEVDKLYNLPCHQCIFLLLIKIEHTMFAFIAIMLRKHFGKDKVDFSWVPIEVKLWIIEFSFVQDFLCKLQAKNSTYYGLWDT